MELDEIIKKIKENKTVVIFAAILILGLLFGDKAQANYSFPQKDDVITMDVDHSKGGGTYTCASVKDCYTRVLEAEARGATQYCNSITIKRNGKVIWVRNY